MTWEEIDAILSVTVAHDLPDNLVVRQIASEGMHPYYGFFKNLSRYINNQQNGFRGNGMLEIGCWRGCLAAHICEYEHSGTILVGIDINPVNYSHRNFVLIQDDATKPNIADQVKSVADCFGGFFAVFQDSSHHYAASKKEWELYSPLVRPGGIWVADDITPAFKLPQEEKGMVDYWDELPGEKKLFDDLHIGSRVGIVLL